MEGVKEKVKDSLGWYSSKPVALGLTYLYQYTVHRLGILGQLKSPHLGGDEQRLKPLLTQREINCG